MFCCYLPLGKQTHVASNIMRLFCTSRSFQIFTDQLLRLARILAELNTNENRFDSLYIPVSLYTFMWTTNFQYLKSRFRNMFTFLLCGFQVIFSTLAVPNRMLANACEECKSRVTNLCQLICCPLQGAVAHPHQPATAMSALSMSNLQKVSITRHRDIVSQNTTIYPNQKTGS